MSVDSRTPAKWNLRAVPTFATGALATAGVVLASFATRTGTRRAHLAEPLVRSWARAWLLPAGVRLQLDGLEHVAAGQMYVVVSNHLSNLDPMVHLAALGLPLRFLAMRELFDIPLVGASLRRLGMIEVDRGNPDSVKIKQGVRQALTDGACIFVFPEGQTSHDGSLNRFHLGAFAIAIEHGIPILPIGLTGTREVWAPGSNAIHKGLVRLVIHEPISTQGMDRSDALGLRDKTRNAIAGSSTPAT